MADQGADATPAQALIAEMRMIGEVIRRDEYGNMRAIATRVGRWATQLEAALAVSPQGWQPFCTEVAPGLYVANESLSVWKKLALPSPPRVAAGPEEPT